MGATPRVSASWKSAAFFSPQKVGAAATLKRTVVSGCYPGWEPPQFSGLNRKLHLRGLLNKSCSFLGLDRIRLLHRSRSSYTGDRLLRLLGARLRRPCQVNNLIHVLLHGPHDSLLLVPFRESFFLRIKKKKIFFFFFCKYIQQEN